MLGIGFPELVVILILLLVLFKPEQLVDVVRVAGGVVERLRRTGQEIREEVEGELRATDWGRPKDAQAERPPVKPVMALAPPASSTTPVPSSEPPPSSGDTDDG